MLAELTAEAGLPPGVLNVVTGGNQTGQAIVEHPDVRMVIGNAELVGYSAARYRSVNTRALVAIIYLNNPLL